MDTPISFSDSAATQQIVTPESVGIPSAALLSLMQRLSKVDYLNSLILTRHGKRCMECFVSPYEPDQPHQLFSLSKSFTSCAIGLAQAEGRLKISDKLINFFPEYAPCITDARMRLATLKDLLSMRSGHLDCARKYCKSRNWVQDYLSSPLDTEPGKTFAYNSAASYMLSSVIRKVTGENVREYLLPRLFEPLEMLPGVWESCPMGTNCGGWGLYLTTDDVAKFAQLLLQHGEWQGKQLLPREYLAEATQKQADNSMNDFIDWQQGYGYHFWCSRHGYRGDGAAGQYAVVLEKEDISIAVTSCTPHMADILDAFWEEVLPELADAPLPEDAAMQAKLNDLVKNMAIPIAPAKVRRPAGFKNFTFLPNEAGITQCLVSWNADECALTFTRSGQPEQLRAGFGAFRPSVLQLTDDRPHPVAAFAEWESAQKLKISSFITDGIYRDVWSVDLEDPHEPIKNEMICACMRPEKPHLFLK